MSCIPARVHTISTFDVQDITVIGTFNAVCHACDRYTEATGGQPERMVSGSDDFTMFLWCPSTSKQPIARMTGHVQTVNQVRPLGAIGAGDVLHVSSFCAVLLLLLLLLTVVRWCGAVVVRFDW